MFPANFSQLPGSVITIGLNSLKLHFQVINSQVEAMNEVLQLTKQTC
jgi:hypothetical protein